MQDVSAQVRDAARYLREVRPLDPTELASYVDGGAHPAVVRQHLRDAAADLEVIEREDGTFVPVPEGALAPAFDGVDRLPEGYATRLESRLVDRYGPEWHAGGAGDRLRERIRAVKAAYHRGDAVEYDAETALAYAVYHLPGYYATGAYLADELGRDGLLDHRLRVLDVGAGPGGPALGLHDYLSAGNCCGGVHRALVEYHAIEPSAAARLLEWMLDATGQNFHPTVHETTAESFAPEGEYDLVVFGNVLSEIDAPAAVVSRYLDALAPDGTAMLFAPADRNTSTGLRRVERELVDERGVADVYAPTVRLWPGEHPTDRGWSFDRKPDLAVPAFQEHLANGADRPGEFTNPGVRYSYSILRTDGRHRYDRSLSPGDAARMADAADHVTKRVDLVGAKLSHDLRERSVGGEPATGRGRGQGGRQGGGDGNPLFKVSDGSEGADHYAVLVRETELNRLLAEAGYGALLRIEGGLVLWNDDEEAYNVVVDEEAIVDYA